MSSKRTGTQQIARLFRIRSCFDNGVSREKLALLHSIRHVSVRKSAELKRLHRALCFVRAFPDTLAHYRDAHAALVCFQERVNRLPKSVQRELRDTGIAGTGIHYPFSYEVASWLSRHTPGAAGIDWEEVDDTSRLDELLEHLLLPPESDYFDSGLVSSREWIDLAAGTSGATGLDWLLAQQQQTRFIPFWKSLYNATELPLTWNLGSTACSTSRNVLSNCKIASRENGLRKNVRTAKREIMRPPEKLQQVTTRAGADLIDVAMASLAVRHRETFHFNYANPKEVYVADVGQGICIAIFGLQAKHRYPLECTMGYLMLSNGVPIGYGGGSAVFRQINTGVNIFDEYRRSEAAYLWVQVMRVYHHLFGCTRFIANPFQFGSDNAEALQSGAFWFYYRLGYRPVLAAVHKLARRESLRIRRNKSYRCRLTTLRRLASCDMHLNLPGVLASELFEEHWIETSSMLATRELAAVNCATREESAEKVAAQVARGLGLRSVRNWTANEQNAFRQLAPIVAATEPAAWPGDAKRSLRQLLRTKGGLKEAEYARLLCRHKYFLAALRSRCRAAES